MANKCRNDHAQRRTPHLGADAAAGKGRHAASAAAACSMLVVVACVLVKNAQAPEGVALTSAGASVTKAHLEGGLGGATTMAKAAAHARLAAKAGTVAEAAPGKGSQVWNKVFSNVKEAATERMLQLSAMMKQQHENDNAMSDAEEEAAQYNVLSFTTAQPPAPVENYRGESVQNGSPRRAAQDAEDELSRYSGIAGSGSDAYAADQKFLSMERKRSIEHHSSAHGSQVPALTAASNLLARYGKLANSGVKAYHADSERSAVADSDHAQPDQKPSHADAPAGTPVKVGTSVDVLSPSKHWRVARVVDNKAGHVLVHYDGYEHKYDEWIPATSNRIKGLAAAPAPTLKETKTEKAAAEVAKEFSHYAHVASSGQHAYETDAAAAAAGTKWDNHKQYVKDEMRGDREALKDAARYSKIAQLGTPEDPARVAHVRPSAPKAAPNAAKSAAATKTKPSPEPQLSVVQAAAQAAASAAASVVNEAKAAVEEVEGTQGHVSPAAKDRPQESLRAYNGGAQHGRGRVGDTTERTYAEVARMLSLASTTAKAEGNVAVSKQVAQEKGTLAKLRNVPGKLPVRVQHNLVSAGASLLRRLGIGAGASASPQAMPLTATANNAVLAVASESEGPAAAAKWKAFVRLHQLHARAHAHYKALQQRLSEEATPAEEGKHAVEATHAKPAAGTTELRTPEDPAEAQNAEPALESEHTTPQGEEIHAETTPEAHDEQQDTSEETVDSSETKDEDENQGKETSEETGDSSETRDEDEEEGKDEDEEEDKKGEEEKDTPIDVQPSVEVEPPLSPAEERKRRREQHKKGGEQGDKEDDCDAACQHRKRQEEWKKTHAKGDHEYHRPDWHTMDHNNGHSHARVHDWEHKEQKWEDKERNWGNRKADEYGREEKAGADADEDGCWVPDLPTTREALCTPTMLKDGTCEQVWGDVPEITGPVVAFAIKNVPGDSSKLHLEIVTAEFTQMPKKAYGSITIGYQKRADGATWEYESRTVASSSPWSTIGFFENAPDMLVKDCQGSFLGIISMDPLEGQAPGGHNAEAMSGTAGVYKPSLAAAVRPVRAKIMGEAGKESFTVIKGDFDVLGDDEGEVRYHLYTTDTRRLVCVMKRRKTMKDDVDWVIRMERDGPLDIRVAGILAAQFESETMQKKTDMKVVVIAIAFILLGLVLLCCLVPILTGCWSEWRNRRETYVAPKRVEEMELPHTVGPSTAGPPTVTDESRGDLSARSQARSLASSYAPTTTSRGMTARTDADANSVLSTGRPANNYERGDFWDRLPALDEPTPRGREYYQAPLSRVSEVPWMAPMKQAASLRGLPDEDHDKEAKVRAMLAQHPGTSPRTKPKGWEATSFRDTQRNYRQQGPDMEIRDVLHNVLDPVAGGKFVSQTHTKSLMHTACIHIHSHTLAHKSIHTFVYIF